MQCGEGFEFEKEDGEGQLYFSNGKVQAADGSLQQRTSLLSLWQTDKQQALAVCEAMREERENKVHSIFLSSLPKRPW